MPITPRLSIYPAVSGGAAGYAPYTALGLSNGAMIGLGPERMQEIVVGGDVGPINLNATPFGPISPINGTTIRLIGSSDALTVKLTTNDAAGGAMLRGDIELGKNSSIELQYVAALDRYVQISDSIKVP
jgi:hypothetical protein